MATQHGGSSRYSLPLAPDLQIPATAEATVYLHNLLFNNQLANVDGDLYANNQLNLTFGGTSVPLTLSPGAYSIADIERYIAQQLYANPTAWTAYNAEVVLLEAPGALKPQGLANPYNGTWDLALSYEHAPRWSGALARTYRSWAGPRTMRPGLQLPVSPPRTRCTGGI